MKQSFGSIRSAGGNRWLWFDQARPTHGCGAAHHSCCAELEATSLGKEMPVDTGHNETAWAKNRRADLNYLSR